MMSEEEKIVEAKEYMISVEDSLQQQLLQSKLDKAASDYQLAKQALQFHQTYLAGKYSEHGKYKLVGELNLQTRKGQRIEQPREEDPKD